MHAVYYAAFTQVLVLVAVESRDETVSCYSQDVKVNRITKSQHEVTHHY